MEEHREKFRKSLWSLHDSFNVRCLFLCKIFFTISNRCSISNVKCKMMLQLQGSSRIANCALFSQDREERIKAEKEQASARVVSTKKIILIKNNKQ